MNTLMIINMITFVLLIVLLALHAINSNKTLKYGHYILVVIIISLVINLISNIVHDVTAINTLTKTNSHGYTINN